MKKLLLALSLLAFTPAATTEWKADPAHSKIGFTITHMMINEVEGQFDTYEIIAKSDKADFSDAQVNFSADVNSVNTNNSMRDKHLKSDDFFNAEKFPKMTFASTGIKQVDSKNYKLSGNLTIRDKTKPVVLDMAYKGTIQDGYGGTKAGFKISGIINRKDYDLKWSKMVEAGAIVSDNVNIICNIEMAKSK